jgi:hypothetical protein
MPGSMLQPAPQKSTRPGRMRKDSLLFTGHTFVTLRVTGMLYPVLLHPAEPVTRVSLAVDLLQLAR